ncbi:MAG: tetratricopeptide repeat protein, partial [Deltaproteobacteria bacterium]|nr:tetratricopeptide repeat protein [Deltaproteobacteria bacterium]
GEYSRAVEEYQALLEHSPEGAEKVRFLVAMEYVKMNDLKQARVELNELLKNAVAGELIQQVKYQIANTYYLEGDTEEALKRFAGVIKEYPESPIAFEALFARARVYDEQGRLAEALDILKGLEGKYPNKDALKTAVEWTQKRLDTDPGLRRKR